MTVANVATKLLTVFGAGELLAIHNANGATFTKGGTTLKFGKEDVTTDLKKDPGTYTVQLSEDGAIEQTYIEPPAAPAVETKAATKDPKPGAKQSPAYGYEQRAVR